VSRFLRVRSYGLRVTVWAERRNSWSRLAVISCKPLVRCGPMRYHCRHSFPATGSYVGVKTRSRRWLRSWSRASSEPPPNAHAGGQRVSGDFGRSHHSAAKQIVAGERRSARNTHAGSGARIAVHVSRRSQIHSDGGSAHLRYSYVGPWLRRLKSTQYGSVAQRECDVDIIGRAAELRIRR